ncbi:MAG: CDP-diacylglycerol--serine O-phosphatidyltransferase [Gemmatimonadetes bacterium]|nr:CDP-diacylglycerol--serine O-phosphatidyltransferase [Gemmatimonadota bacterium]MBI3568968.1 CDP-diacylglycerol--serine O-phosphatidyltransferase [Gemmatimonadota bacterium]
MRRPRLPRPSMVMLPNGFTLANLFFGIYAIVSASRGQFDLAVSCILVGGVCDALDGRVARATNTGSRFGEELDSLVDAVSFGLAPALLLYFAVLRHEGWDWIFVFLFTAMAVMRLARFNIEQAGHAKTYFRGLPSPAAGGVLASYWWFSQTPIYQQTSIGDLPWHTVVQFLMAGLAFLMISNVPYLAWPTFNLRTLRGVVGLLIFIGLGVGLVFLPKSFFFPVGLLYVITGVLAAGVRGMLERQGPTTAEHEAVSPADYGVELEEEEDDEDDIEIAPPPRETEATRRKRRRRRGRRGPNPPTDSHSSEGSPE